MFWFARLLAYFQAPTPPITLGLAGTALPPSLPPRPPSRPSAAPSPKPPSRLDSILNTLTGFGGSRDKAQPGRPNPNDTPLALGELDLLYKHNGYARRIVDLPARDATRKGWHVQDPSRDTDPMQSEDQRLQIVATLRDALRISRLHGGALILLVCKEHTPDGAPPDLTQPLLAANLIQVERLVVLDGTEFSPLRWDSDPHSSNFRRPELWSISPNSGSQSPLTGKSVHWSRCLYVAGTWLPARMRIANQGRDQSVLQAAWEAIRNLTTIDQSGAIHSQELSIPVLKLADLEAHSASEQAAAFNLRMAALAAGKSSLNMILLGTGDDYSHREVSLAGFDKIALRAKEAICAAVEMPMVVLFGEAPGGLNADGASHRTLWDRVIAGYQQEILTPVLERLYKLLYRQQEGPTNGVVPPAWEIIYHPLDELSEQGTLDLQKTASEVDSTYIGLGVYTAADVRRSRFGAKGWRPDLLPVTPPAAPPGTPVGSPAPAATSTPVNADSLPLRVEIPEGEWRRGITPEGKPWAILMPCEYGDLPGTKGLDGEPVDYLRANGPRGMAFVVEQLLPPEGPDAEPTLDEHKVILGCTTEADARALLAKVYPTGLFGDLYPLPEAQLLPWLQARSERRSYLLHDGIDFTPPAAVRAAVQAGLDAWKAGKGSKTLSATTVAWARRLAAGQPISAPKARKLRAWFARQEAPATDEARVTWALWGGDPGKAWAEALVAQLEQAAR